MDLSDRVKYISKFCGINHDHSNMIDERQGVVSFNIRLQEEIEIKNCMPSVDIIILTGEAGDGKSRMIRNLWQDLIDNRFNIVSDFSALIESDREKIIEDISNLLSGSENVKKQIIAANVGIFTKTLLKKNVKLLADLTSSQKVKIINFQKRNLAKKHSDEDKTFESIISEFTKYDSLNCRCDLIDQCPFKKNLDNLQNPIVIENIRVLCDALYLMGEHITFRELLSLIAYMATGGKNCETLLRNPDIEIDYYNIFENEIDILLKKFCKLDPAMKNNKGDGVIYINSNGSLTTYKNTKRKDFFEKENDDSYLLLPVDYLGEFISIIKKLHEFPYYLKARGNDNLLIDVKKGLIKLISPQESNLEISFYDTPPKISKNIKTKFTIDINDIELYWNRHDFKFIQGSLLQETGNNSFSLSCKFSDKTVSLNINYTLFKYILSAKNDLYLKEDSEIVEEFGISDFFRKVLKNNSIAYEKMQVIFCEKDTPNIDFELIKYKEKDVFNEQKEKVLIKKISAK